MNSADIVLKCRTFHLGLACIGRKFYVSFVKAKVRLFGRFASRHVKRLKKTLLRALFRQNGDKNSSRKTSDDYGTKNGDVISPNNMNYLEGRVTRSLERQRSRAAFCHVAATEEKSGYLWKTFHHPGRTSSKTRYFVLTKSSLDHFRNHHRVINNNRILIIVSIFVKL